MNVKSGDLIIRRTITDVQDNQFQYVEKIYIVLAIDEAAKKIAAVPSIDWICGYQRDLAFDYNDLLGDGFSVDILDQKNVSKSGIYKRLDSTTFQIIGFEYSWLHDGEEESACIPYVRISYVHKLKGYSITAYDEDFAEAMTAYPEGNENYVFGKRYRNFLIAPFNPEDGIYTLGNEIPKKENKKRKKL